MKGSFGTRFLLSILILTLIASSLVCMPFAAAEDGPSVTEIKAQIPATYQAALEKSGRTDFSGYCGTYVKTQLQVLGIGYKTSSKPTFNGNNIYYELTDSAITSSGYTQVKYPGANCLADIVAANNNEPVYNIVVSQTNTKNAYGHTYFIHAIIDGKVYWSENSYWGGKAAGAVRTNTVAEMKTVQGTTYAFIGAVHFTRKGAGALGGESWYPLYYERALYKGVGNNAAVKAEPYAGSHIETLETYTTKQFIVTGAVKNDYDNVWYAVEGGGYIYSGDVTYVESLATHTVTNNKSPSGTLTQGSTFANRAEIAFSDSLLKVSSGIYQGSTAIQGPYISNIVSSVQKTYSITSSSPLASKLKFGSLEPGSYTYKVTVWHGKHGLSTDVIVSDFTVEGSAAATYALNLSGQKDGVSQSDLEGIGTVDVYIDGKLVADDTTDYSGKFTSGTTYEFTDIKAKSGFEYAGLASGSLSGVVGSANIETMLKFNTVYPTLRVTGLVDGVPVDSLADVATFDVYVEGDRYASNVSYYSDQWPSGYAYQIDDIVALEGYEYNGVSSGAASGEMGFDNTDIVLSFSTAGLSIPWTYADNLPEDITDGDYTIQYQNIYYRDQAEAPGSEWSFVDSIGTEYVNDGDEYVSYYELETSETRALNGLRYFHVCSGSTGESIWFEHTDKFVHWDQIMDTSSVYVAGGPYSSDGDSALKYYKLKRNDGTWAYCGTDTCTTSHANRSCYWYKRYVYQDRVAVTTNRYVKYGAWQDSIDPAANGYTVRYKPKNGIVTQIFLPDTIIEMDHLTATDLPGVRYLYEGQDPDPDFIWEVEDTSVVQLTDGELSACQPGITYLYCSTDPKHGNASTMAAIIVGGSRTLTLPSDLTAIEAEAFSGANANEVDMLDSNVRSIGSRAFADCSDLRVVRFPDSIAEIAKDAFDGCDTLYFVCESYNYAAQYAIEHDIAYCCLDFDLNE